MSSMVTDDSAMLVARIIFLTPGGGLETRREKNNKLTLSHTVTRIQLRYNYIATIQWYLDMLTP